MALSQDGVTLYVANTGGESISIVNLNQMVQTGSVVFPALPFNASVTLYHTATIAASIRGPQFVMSDGSIWNIIGTQAIPRTLNPAIFGTGATNRVGRHGLRPSGRWRQRRAERTFCCWPEPGTHIFTTTHWTITLW